MQRRRRCLQVRAGFPCSVRYQPGNPQNSIVVAEDWSGLRANAPVLPTYDRGKWLDRRHLNYRQNSPCPILSLFLAKGRETTRAIWVPISSAIRVS